MQDKGVTFWVCLYQGQEEEDHAEGVGVHGVGQADTGGGQDHSEGGCGEFLLSENEIRLGDLSGNRFELDIIVEYFLTNTFPYLAIRNIGTQRFGTTGVPTHHVGKMISSNFTKVIDLILKPREFENSSQDLG